MIVCREIAIPSAVDLHRPRVTEDLLHLCLRGGGIQSEQHIRGHAEYPGERHDLRNVRHPGVILPLGDRLRRHTEQFRQRLLGQILFHAQSADRLSHRARDRFMSVHVIFPHFR